MKTSKQGPKAKGQSAILSYLQSKSKLPSLNIHSIALFHFVLLLPSQLSYHFWIEEAFVLGVRTDYLVPAVYLSDILLFLIVALNWRAILKGMIKYRLYLLMAVVLALANITIAARPFVAVYKWIKVLEGLLLFFYITSLDQKKIRLLKSAFVISLIFFTTIGVLQFFLKTNIGGVFYYLGERPLSSEAPGIATIVVGGKRLLRSYSTFPHPNSFAGYVLVAGTLVLSANKYIGGYKKALVAGLVGIVIFISFSKGAAVALFVVLVLLVINRHKSVEVYRLMLVVSILASLAVATVPLPENYFLPEWGQGRMLLSSASAIIYSGKPLLGVGLGNFTIVLPETLRRNFSFYLWSIQPVHNIFLLILSEVGIVGLLFFFRALWGSLRSNYNLSIVALVITGLFDHYWLTLQQNFLLAAVMFGLAAATISSQKKY